MRQAFADVLEFHRKLDSYIGSTPAVPPDDVVGFRESLITEEVGDLLEAMCDNDLPGVADGIADLIYVAIGTAISYGIDLPAVWAAVQEANMAKLGGGRRADGKHEKPPGWRPPDVAGLLAKQGRIDTP
jgi:predicted HAD superfamily Cof-like phosphohydrolase